MAQRGIALVLGLLVTPAAAAQQFETVSKKFMICGSVETLLKNCNESRLNKTGCNWIVTGGKAKGYSQMLNDGWLSPKKFEAVCHRVCAGQLNVSDATPVLPPGLAQIVTQPAFSLWRWFALRN
ncbi:hypothetical protein [Bradyrhizobium sp. JYMT SZCCT0428]|uniref:hypothetical protein n=1 Tax=Bradyrhizobium sp. JYMT SZCCT0428 TaxID=2807673 RepID=UPI001BA7A93A|nr:hypothetical protein [Bradyrhizobium sp. JYMT SZCCT0428]MBR1149843.1 hypothetical protein [Bradyrhizobium sp. JYMT SZCCT0428]